MLTRPWLFITSQVRLSPSNPEIQLNYFLFFRSFHWPAHTEARRQNCCTSWPFGPCYRCSLHYIRWKYGRSTIESRVCGGDEEPADAWTREAQRHGIRQVHALDPEVCEGNQARLTWCDLNTKLRWATIPSPLFSHFYNHLFICFHWLVSFSLCCQGLDVIKIVGFWSLNCCFLFAFYTTKHR